MLNNISKDQIGGVVFLCFSVAYGYYARQIPLMPGDDMLSFNAQTLPNFLAMLGVGLSIALLLTADRSFTNRFDVMGYNFVIVTKLLLAVVLFAIALKWLGFVVSTILFLIAGFWILGERSIKSMLLISVSFAVVSWLILTQLLDVYLAPGRLFSLLLGG